MEKKRRSIRLRDYDYSRAGMYFVTICVHERECLLGKVVGDDAIRERATGRSPLRLNDFGRIVEEEWVRSAEIRAEIELDAFVVMPNHVHGIVCIRDVRGDCAAGIGVAEELANNIGAAGRLPPHRGGSMKRSLGALIAGFKVAAAKRINVLRGTPGRPVWQRNYYERIVRNEAELAAFRQYISDNPLEWDLDADNLT